MTSPPTSSPTKRAHALDALRGLAIIGMVLSGTIMNTLPAWMYHAQVGPRSQFRFDGSIHGITWVDLVFPFFLFAMGAALPLAMAKKRDERGGWYALIRPLLKRAALLVFFAVSLYHVSPYRTGNYWTALLAFAGWFMAFVRMPRLSPPMNTLLNFSGYAVVAALVACNVWLLPELFSEGFKLSHNDIILLVLANMALFGGVVWLLTHSNWYARLAVIALFCALRLASGVEGTWNQWLYAFNPASLLPSQWLTPLYQSGEWLYRMEFLKYLLIVIPGSIVGDMILSWSRTSTPQPHTNAVRLRFTLVGILCLALLVGNLWGWYTRSLRFTLVLNLVAGGAAWLVMRHASGSLERLFARILPWAFFWMLLGTALEAYEGGIRKDPATYSYFFITSGLACYALIGLSIVIDYMRRPWLRYLIESGQNPMVAYVAGTFVMVPLLTLTGLLPLISSLTAYGAWFGLLKGVIITSGTVAITIICVRHRWFWKT